MITFSRFGEYGRTGNRLFQYAAVLGLSDKLGMKYHLPAWDEAHYFEHPPVTTGKPNPAVQINESRFEYDPELVARIKSTNGTVDLLGYFQTEKYWQQSRAYVKNALTFKKEVLDQLKRKYYKSFQKKVIAIHVRRGDYVNNPNYAQLPITYQISALIKHFPDWRKHNIIVFGDDLNYCKVHFDCLENVAFAEGNAPMEDIALMSLCNHFIIPNSSFAWWGAYLGQRNGSKVIRPSEHFAGKLKDQSIKDYYPESWITHTGDKLDLSDVTFTIPVAYDHKDRRKNLELSLCMLQHHFKTNVIIGEQGGDQFKYLREYASYTQFPYRHFHRTKMLNDMARMATTPYIANWDADIVIAPMQIWETAERLRNGAGMVYPYSGQFARVPRMPWFKSLEMSIDVGILGATKFNGMNNNDAVSFGGAVFFNKETFFKNGGENEKFVSFGPEDYERYHRFKSLRTKIDRVPGPLYHIQHFVGTNSSNRHPFVKQNRAEWERVQKMTDIELRKYVNTWT